MKRTCFVLAILLLCCTFTAAFSEEVSWGSLLFDQNAEAIDLGKEVIRDWAAFDAFLARFPNLQRVDMFASPVRKAKIDHLTERFPNIRFGWTIKFSEHVIRTDAVTFTAGHSAKSDLHSSDMLSVLRYCTELRVLDIGHNELTDIQFLAELPELRVLIIGRNNISDLTPLSNLKHLEYLEMFSNSVEDLSPLAELPYLAHLNICYNMVKDISPLYQMKQLKRLWMTRCGGRKGQPLSEDEIASLQDALSECIIETDHEPTNGGWRDDVYYPTFRECFRTGEYRPFPDSPAENQS